MKKWLFNPFVYIAGARSLLIGIATMLATTIFAYFSNTHFDGTLHISFGYYQPLYVYIIEQLIAWGITVLIFYALGIALSRSAVRFIDVAGTQALARWPMIFIAMLGFGYAAHPIESLADIDSGIIFRGFISLPFIIWVVALMYNAFAVSCNLKGAKAVVSFIAGILFSCIASLKVIHLCYHLQRI